jgi:hypothetical protein
MHISLIIILVIVIALTALLVWDLLQRKHSILRTYPVIGNLRY